MFCLLRVPVALLFSHSNGIGKVGSGHLVFLFSYVVSGTAKAGSNSTKHLTLALTSSSPIMDQGKCFVINFL